MSEYLTKDIVAWVLERMGYNLLSKDASIGNNIDQYIRFIKHKMQDYMDLNETINYFLF